MSLYDILINIIQTSFYPLFFTLLTPRRRKNYYVFFTLYWIIFFVFLTWINMYSVSQGLLYLFTVFLSYILLSLTTDLSFQEKIVYCSIPDLIVGIVNTFIFVTLRGFIFQNYDFGQLMRVYGGYVSFTATLLQLLAFLTSAKYLSRISLHLSTKESVLIFLALNICNMMTVCFENVLFDEISYRFYLAGGVYLVAVLACLITYLLISISRKNENLLQEKYQMTLYRNHIIISQQTDKTRNELYEIRHDLKHLIRVLSQEEFATKNKEIQEIIKAYDTAIDQLPIEIHSPSEIINNVVNTKRMDAFERRIDFKVFFNFTYPPSIPDDEMYLLLSNLLDNAIRHIGIRRKLMITIKDLDDFMGIKISNSIDRHVLVNGKLPNTSFDFSHGIGISSVKRIIDKNNGFISFQEVEDEFVVILKIPNTRSAQKDHK